MFDIQDIMELVERYNAELLPGEEPITFAEMAAQMGYERREVDDV